MIDFTPLNLRDKEKFDRYLMGEQERGCEYSFANLFLWGRQKAAFLDDNLLLYSKYNGRSVYPFPVGSGDRKQALEDLMQDADSRGIPFRLSGVTEPDFKFLEQIYPGQFRFFPDRNSYDYVYDIDDLAELKGKKFQKKRNHLHRFLEAYPDYTAEPLSDAWLPKVEEMLARWYENRQTENPDMDFTLEKTAIEKALKYRKELQMEGLLLHRNGEILAMTMGSRLREDTFDVHFEKATPGAESAYPAINWEFARYLRSKYPEVRYLNREDDMGIDGLRRAKNSYNPHHMVEKCLACRLEDACDEKH